MVHDARIIRMGGGEHPPKHVRQWMGDSIGRWEGDTLVVETTNFHPLQAFRGASENLKVIERFTRTGPDTILYKFTIEDPTTFDSAVDGQIPFNRMDDLIYRLRLPRRELRAGERAQRRARREQREAEKKKQQQCAK